MIGDYFLSDMKNKRDSQTPPLSILSRARFKDHNHVSPLEVIGSMSKKLGNKLDEGFLGRMTRGLLREQAYTSFGKSGNDFGKENFRYGNDTGAYEFGCIAGIFWDIGCALNMVDYARGCNLSDYDTVGALYGATKIATQIGAYAMRKYDAEKTKLSKEKATKLSTPKN